MHERFISCHKCKSEYFLLVGDENVDSEDEEFLSRDTN